MPGWSQRLSDPLVNCANIPARPESDFTDMPARQVLTLKYRPQTFAEILIQDHVKNTLIKAIENNRLANAYLFAGPRGVGKTTTARVLAKSLNCFSTDKPTINPCNQCSACQEIAESRSLDVLEIDGASNRGIDQVRELRENIKYAPASFRYKVYIIDEVHMLTKEAFNALLKTLEEPPRHAKFIFATTAPHELPATILSRCQRFDFRKATIAEIIDRLKWLAEKENIKVSPKALVAIARRADGAIRDAEGLLDLLATYRPEGIELKHAEELLGLVPIDIFFRYAELIAAGNAKPLVEFIDQVFAAGYDLMEFYTGAVSHFRNLLLAKVGSAVEIGLLPEQIKELNEQAKKFDLKNLINILNILSSYEKMSRESLLPKILLEIVSLQLLTKINQSGIPDINTSTNNAQSTKESAGAQFNTETDPIVSSDKPQTGELPSVTSPPTYAADEETVAIWRNLLSHLAQQRKSLANILNFAQPVSWDGSNLRIAFDPEHKGNIHHLNTNRRQIENLLSKLTGTRSKIEAKVAEKKAEPDEIRKRIQQHFGDIEEL